MSKIAYNLFPSSPPYCPYQDCTCIIKSIDADEPYNPGRSIFCIGKPKEPIKQKWFGEEHINDIFMCTWYPRGWERSLINRDDMEIMIKMFLKTAKALNKPFFPGWLIRNAGYPLIADKFMGFIKVNLIKSFMYFFY